MSDKNEQIEDAEVVEIDEDHPWVDAAFAMSPLPTPAFAKVEPTHIETENGNLNAALLTAIGPNGVFTVFLPPRALYQLVQQAGTIFHIWEQEEAKQPRLIVADDAMRKNAQRAADAAQRMRNS